MARPNLKSQRTREIIDAFVICIARFGLEGATLERIAVAAGVKRTLLRHYLGNRDEMIDVLVEHISNEFDLFEKAYLPQSPEKSETSKAADTFLHWLFLEENTTHSRLAMAYLALCTVAGEYAEFQSPLQQILSRFVKSIDRQLHFSFPRQPARKRQIVANGIADMYFSCIALKALDKSGNRRRIAYRSATLLSDTLMA